LTGALAGALVTHMIMDNGNKVPVYSNGDGSAYVDNGQGRVQLTQDANGNWVQLDQINPPQNNIEQTPIQQTQPVQTVVVKEKSGIGFLGWCFILTLIGGVGFIAFKWFTRPKF
jgi:hypothetical protein